MSLPRRSILAGVAAALCSVFAQAQPAAYLLLQAPRSAANERFAVGTTLEWRLRGDEELFVAPLRMVFPESQAILVGDLLIAVDDVVEVRYDNDTGFKAYSRVQGPLLTLISAGGLAPARNRRRQGRFLVGTATTGALLWLYGQLGHHRRRAVSPTGAWQLHVAGGDLRVTDDPERY